MSRLAPLLLVLSAAPLSAAERPNVLLILTDDQGWGDIHSHGNERLDTPNLDRLAVQGARFERFFVSPVCAPTRAAMLTGRYSLRTGVHGVTRAHETMRSSEITVAELLRDAGYATGCFGKWHNGVHPGVDPHGQGFGTFVGFEGGHLVNYFTPSLLGTDDVPPAPPGFDPNYVTNLLTGHAERFITEHADEPWFCYVPFNTPHWPPQVPDRFYDKYAARGFDPTTASAYAMVDNIDANVGRLLDTLEETGQADGTVVLFLSDNGPNSDRYNGDLRGRKGSTHEGGVRVPLFVRYPGVIEPGTVVDRIAAHVDLLPTLCELCGVEPPADRVLDGTSLVPLLKRETAGGGWPDRRLFTFKDFQPVPDGRRGAVRTDRWRLVRDGGRAWELFDMTADPGQTTDVSDTHADVTDELAAAFDATWQGVTADGFDRVPVRLCEAGPEVLPAHEADLLAADGRVMNRAAGGGIEYHGGPGWAWDWVDRWTDPAAAAEWPLEVCEPAPWTVSVRYAATPAQVGSRFAVEFGGGLSGETASAAVTAPHDPPELPSPDRFDRGEVYEKEWATLSLGTVRLSPGTGTVRLRAVEKPADDMPEVKGLLFERAGS